MSYMHDEYVDVYGDDKEVAPKLLTQKLILKGSCKCDCGWTDCCEYEEGNPWSEEVASATLKLSHKRHLTVKENGPCFCTPVIENNSL